jgi:hypothetical protein
LAGGTGTVSLKIPAALLAALGIVAEVDGRSARVPATRPGNNGHHSFTRLSSNFSFCPGTGAEHMTFPPLIEQIGGYSAIASFRYLMGANKSPAFGRSGRRAFHLVQHQQSAGMRRVRRQDAAANPGGIGDPALSPEVRRHRLIPVTSIGMTKSSPGTTKSSTGTTDLEHGTTGRFHRDPGSAGLRRLRTPPPAVRDPSASTRHAVARSPASRAGPARRRAAQRRAREP